MPRLTTFKTAFGYSVVIAATLTTVFSAATAAEKSPSASAPRFEPLPETPVPADQAAARLHFAALVDGALKRLSQVTDYTYTLRKQERVGSSLLDPQFLDNKVRHEPFSIYLCFTAPGSVKGKEALFVKGKNDDKLIGHSVGLQAIMGTQKLDPTSSMAMMGNRNPITDSGLKNLLLKLQTLIAKPEYQTTFTVVPFDAPDIDGRPVIGVEVKNPKPIKEYLTARSRVTFDKGWGLPVRFERYYWSPSGKGEPKLVEDYTYTNLKFNVGLTDKDFDPSNSAYNF